MDLNIARKLDFLMRLTDTQNNMLGKALSFDASYISRLRTGKRSIPRNRDIIMPISLYFARNARRPYQEKALAVRICTEGELPDSIEERAGLIARWLLDSQAIVDELEVPVVRKDEPPHSEEVMFKHGTEFFYGNAGKREGVEHFLSEVCNQKVPPSLLLHSDESMVWLYEDTDFARRWARLLFEIAAKGGKIKIIHTIRRNIEEIIMAIEKWIPLYMTGMIETYYCPRVRDDIYCRTLFIAQRQSALVSHSIKGTQKPMVNFLVRDKAAVNALEDEFMDYLSLCRPLIRIYGAKNVEEFRPVFASFLKSEDDTILLRSVPSRLTMPRSVSRSMEERMGKSGFERSNLNLQAYQAEQFAKGRHLTEILFFKDTDVFEGGTISLPFCDLTGYPEVHYTGAELCQHIEAMIELLISEPNYHVILPDMEKEKTGRYASGEGLFLNSTENIMLVAKESSGIMLHSPGPETVAFYSKEQDITRAFWDYLSRIVVEENREATIEWLRDYTKKLSAWTAEN